jgi:membrane associated rhomboid family serine protease
VNESVCYRHPEREAYVRCQRCERPICPQCQTEAAVGFLCPEDAGASRASRSARLIRSTNTPVTIAIVAINVLLWLLQIIPGSLVTVYLEYIPLATWIQPWRLLTSAFVHDPSNILHVGLNMYTVFIFGRILEPMLGRWRFLALYLISAIGGSLGVLILSDATVSVVGASTACFGLMAAYFVIARKLGANTGQLVGLVAINLAFGFLVPGIAWQGHLGGLVAGGFVAYILMQTRNARQAAIQKFAVAAVGVGLVLLALAIAYVRGYHY